MRHQHSPNCESQEQSFGSRAVWWTLGASVLAIGVVVGTIENLEASVREELRRKEVAPTNSAIEAARSREKSRLSEYSWQDRDAGILRIPLARAKDLTLSAYATSSLDAGPGRGAQ